MTTTIYHNPACGTSRTVLALLRAKGDLHESLGLADPKWSDSQLVDFILHTLPSSTDPSL